MVVDLCDVGDDCQRDGCEVGSWLQVRARQGITGRSLCKGAKKPSPPQHDLGKVCAKFNGRSRGYSVNMVNLVTTK